MQGFLKTFHFVNAKLMVKTAANATKVKPLGRAIEIMEVFYVGTCPHLGKEVWSCTTKCCRTNTAIGVEYGKPLWAIWQKILFQFDG
jgi:hypothetical protein